MRSAVPVSDDVTADLEALLLWWLDYAWDAQEFMRVAVARSVVDDEVADLIAQLNQHRVDVIAGKLRRHQRAGRIAAGVDVAAIAAGLSSYMFAAGFFSQVVFRQDRATLRRRTISMVHVIAQGIQPSPEGRPK
jgi:hypothetical protein